MLKIVRKSRIVDLEKEVLFIRPMGSHGHDDSCGVTTTYEPDWPVGANLTATSGPVSRCTPVSITAAVANARVQHMFKPEDR